MHFYKIIFAVLLLLPMMPAQMASAAGQCFCSTDYGTAPTADAVCSPVAEQYCTSEGSRFKLCSWQPSPADCDTWVINWKKENNAFLGAKATTDQQAQRAACTGLICSALPPCVFDDKWNPNGECADISVFVKTLIGFGRVLFSIIGALALVMFIYGGFILILSQGNPEKVKKGTGAMVAAVIGLVIAFGGYVLVKFLGDAVGLKEGFRLK